MSKNKKEKNGKNKGRKKNSSGRPLNHNIVEASAVLSADPSIWKKDKELTPDKAFSQDKVFMPDKALPPDKELSADKGPSQDKALPPDSVQTVSFRFDEPVEKITPHPYVNRKHLLNPSMSAQLHHGEQVSSLAYEVSLEMGLPDNWAHDMIIAGFFHDIGKVILSGDPSFDNMLVVEEMNSIRRHPVIGCEELKKKGYNEWICNAVRWHHENKDGSGYPDNLADGDIPLGACILRVCDVFCALTQDRQYRSAFTPEEAVAMMVDEVEKYDIRVFIAFERVIHRGPNGSIVIPEVRPEVEGVWKEL